MPSMKQARLSGVAAAMLGVVRDDKPQWRKRLETVSIHPKVAEPIKNDLKAAFTHIDALEKEVETLKAAEFLKDK